MDAFVEPETLEGDNQYFCEQCNKKCDAHKVRYQLPVVEQSLLNHFLWLFCISLQGLKFKKFPYLLTLQLKRFDFDYSTMHRIKLNDRWVCLAEVLSHYSVAQYFSLIIGCHFQMFST